jgi:hypothetical protein
LDQPFISRIYGERSNLVNEAEHIGLDVHQATISEVALDFTGHPVMVPVIETRAVTILLCRR